MYDAALEDTVQRMAPHLRGLDWSQARRDSLEAGFVSSAIATSRTAHTAKITRRVTRLSTVAPARKIGCAGRLVRSHRFPSVADRLSLVDGAGEETVTWTA